MSIQSARLAPVACGLLRVALEHEVSLRRFASFLRRKKETKLFLEKVCDECALYRAPALETSLTESPSLFSSAGTQKLSLETDVFKNEPSLSLSLERESPLSRAFRARRVVRLETVAFIVPFRDSYLRRVSDSCSHTVWLSRAPWKSPRPRPLSQHRFWRRPCGRFTASATWFSHTSVRFKVDSSLWDSTDLK